eukprot:g4646.t1
MKTVGADFHEDDPLFHTNEFRMHCYKILPCTKHFCHDWSVCPFAHFSERAKRRDPRDVKYTAIACPDMKKGENCPRGDRCPYSHNTFEYWLHPTRYRTRLCRDGESCNRKICFFAHKSEEVRVPSTRPSLPVTEELWTGEDTLLTNQCCKEQTTTNLDRVGDSIVVANSSTGLDQQFQQFLQNTNSISGAAPVNQEPTTFVEQVLSGFLPTSTNNGMNTNTNTGGGGGGGLLHESSNFSELSLSGSPPPHQQQQQQQFAAVQNLCFDSCSQSLGFVPGMEQNATLFQSMSNNSTTSNNNTSSHIHQSVDPMNFCLPYGAGFTNSNPPQQFPGSELDPFSTTAGLLQSPLSFNSTGLNQNNLASLTGNATQCGIPVKPMDQYTEMLRLLSNLQLTGSPTSVLGNGVDLGYHHSVSIDGSGSSTSGKSGTGMTENELEQLQQQQQIGGGIPPMNSLMASTRPSYYGMTI